MKCQKTWDKFFMDVAKRAAEESYDEKTKVGCVIVKDRNILSFSYNGTPSGYPNIMRDENGDTLDLVLHAETNAIGKIARSNESSEGATLYSTLSPCITCAKAIYQAGIGRVVYETDYSSNRGVEFLRDHGIPTMKRPPE